MNRDDKRARDLARLEEARRRTRERLAKEQERIDKRFERMRQKLDEKYGRTTDHQQRIIEAALDLLSENGLSGITLRKLAGRVDMRAPALYWHFKSKEELVDYMAEAILQKELKDLRPRRDDEDWQEWLTEEMLRLRKAMLAYPDGGRVVAGAHLYPAITLGKLFECALESLVNADFNLQTARRIVFTTVTYTFGCVIEEQSMPDDEEAKMLTRELSGDGYPRIVEAVREAHWTHRDMGEDYRAGLKFIIDGATAAE